METVLSHQFLERRTTLPTGSCVAALRRADEWRGGETHGYMRERPIVALFAYTPVFRTSVFMPLGSEALWGSPQSWPGVPGGGGRRRRWCCLLALRAGKSLWLHSSALRFSVQLSAIMARVLALPRAGAGGARAPRAFGILGRARGDCSSCARMAHQVVTAALLAQLTVAGQHGTEIQRVGMQVLAAMDERARFRNYPQARRAPLRGERACVDEVHEALRSSRCCRRRRTGLPKIYSPRMHAPAPRLPARRLCRCSASGSKACALGARDGGHV